MSECESNLTLNDKLYTVVCVLIEALSFNLVIFSHRVSSEMCIALLSGAFCAQGIFYLSEYAPSTMNCLIKRYIV